MTILELIELDKSNELKRQAIELVLDDIRRNLESAAHKYARAISTEDVNHAH